jgi:hypothetical protein
MIANSSAVIPVVVVCRIVFFERAIRQIFGIAVVISGL